MSCENLLGTLGVRQEYTHPGWETSPFQDTYTHSHLGYFNVPSKSTGMVFGGGGKAENLKETHMGRNYKEDSILNSGLNKGPWYCVVAMLPTTPPSQ